MLRPLFFAWNGRHVLFGGLIEVVRLTGELGVCFLLRSSSCSVYAGEKGNDGVLENSKRLGDERGGGTGWLLFEWMSRMKKADVEFGTLSELSIFTLYQT